MKMAELSFVPAGTPNSQRVAVMTEPGALEIRWAAIPEPGPQEVRVKVLYNGICGSDLEAFRGCRKPEFMSCPARLGHEVSGVIDAIGSSVIGLRVGQRVTARYIWGALAQYIIAMPFNLKALPDDFPLLEVSSFATHSYWSATYHGFETHSMANQTLNQCSTTFTAIHWLALSR